MRSVEKVGFASRPVIFNPRRKKIIKMKIGHVDIFYPNFIWHSDMKGHLKVSCITFLEPLPGPVL
jgi:hypothetical protein